MILSINECKSQLRRSLSEKGLMIIILKTYAVVLKLKQWTTNEFTKKKLQYTFVNNSNTDVKRTIMY